MKTKRRPFGRSAFPLCSVLLLLLCLTATASPAQNFEVFDVLQFPAAPPARIAISSDGLFVYGATRDETQVWQRDPETGAVEYLESDYEPGDLGIVSSEEFAPRPDLSFSPDEEHLYTLRIAEDAALVIFHRDRTTGKLAVAQRILFTEDSAVPRALTISPDGRHVYVGGPKIYRYHRDFFTGTLSLLGDQDVGRTSGLAVSADGSTVLQAGATIRSFLRDEQTGALSTAQEIDTYNGDPITNAGAARWAVTGSDRFYVRLTTQDPQGFSQQYIVVARVEDDGSIVFEGGTDLVGDGFETDWAVDPTTGDVVVAYIETNDFQAFVELFETVLDGAELESIATAGRFDFESDSIPRGVALAPGGGTAYAANFMGHPLAALPLDGIPRDFADPLPSDELAGPRDLFLSDDGPLWVLSERQLVAVERGADGLAIPSLVTSPFRPAWNSVAATGDGEFVYTGTSFLPGAVFQRGEDGYELVERLGEITLALSPDEKLFVGHEYDKGLRVAFLDPVTGLPDWWNEEGPDLGFVKPPVVSPDGQRVYVAAQSISGPGHGSAFRLDEESFMPVPLSGEIRIGREITESEAFAWSSDGEHLYATERTAPDELSLVVLEWTGSGHERVDNAELGPAPLDRSSRVELAVDRDGRFVAAVDDSGVLRIFSRDPASGTLDTPQVFQQGTNGVDWLHRKGIAVPVLEAGHGELYVASPDGGTVVGLRPSCQSEPDRSLCLQQERFRVEVDWHLDTDETGTGRAVEGGTGDSGLFWFFGEDNWELLVKVLDGCALNDRVWVFAAATTNVGYTLRVTDTWTGARSIHENPTGRLAPATVDTDALAVCDAGQSSTSSVRTKSGLPPQTASEVLDLVGGRFEARVDWRDFQGERGVGRAADLRSNNSGLFWFFGPANYEILLKVLDGCGFNDQFWVLAAATTNVGYTLEISDTTNGSSWTYENPLGVASPAVVDVAAFDCP
ncbi:MAG: lactonase family protein [Thermoanaerobaculia bacterium]|nr:lactonase family protein [Thermoanaerobaculia bacterium]